MTYRRRRPPPQFLSAPLLLAALACSDTDTFQPLAYVAAVGGGNELPPAQETGDALSPADEIYRALETRAATAAVIARVTCSDVVPGYDDLQRIHTDAAFTIDEVVVGQVLDGQTTLQTRTLGGEFNGHVTVVAHAGRYRRNEQYWVLLAAQRDGTLYLPGDSGASGHIVEGDRVEYEGLSITQADFLQMAIHTGPDNAAGGAP